MGITKRKKDFIEIIKFDKKYKYNTNYHIKCPLPYICNKFIIILADKANVFDLDRIKY